MIRTHITDLQIVEWRKLKSEGMVSSVGEYTPPEFWDLVDYAEQCKKVIKALQGMVRLQSDELSRVYIEEGRISRQMVMDQAFAMLADTSCA